MCCVYSKELCQGGGPYGNPKPLLTSPDKKTVTIFALKQQNIYTFQSFLRRKQSCAVGTQKNCVKEVVLMRTQNHC